MLKSIGTNNFNNEILRAVQAEKTTEIRKKDVYKRQEQDITAKIILIMADLMIIGM